MKVTVNRARCIEKSRRGQRGFSLIELLVVVALIVILAAISIPAISRFIRNYKIRGAAQQVASEIQAGRIKAIMKNVNLGVVFVVINPTDYQYVIEDDPTDITRTRQAVTALQANPAQAGPVQHLPGGLQFAAAVAECPILAAPPFAPNDTGFRFDRLGAWCDPGASGRCPDLGVGAPVVANAPGGSTVCLFQPDTGLSRVVTVSTNGRVTTQP